MMREIEDELDDLVVDTDQLENIKSNQLKEYIKKLKV
jgi:hypothetical protein